MSEELLINLNDEKFDVSEISIFNNGKAGIVSDCEITIEKKKPTDSYNAPDYKIMIVDKFGSVNTGLYYLDPKHEKFKDQLKYQGRDLKHIHRAVFGDKELPTFKDTKEMLDKVMEAIKAVEKTAKVRVAVCYGTTQRPSAYLRLRNFPPFIESMSIPVDKTELTLKVTDQIDRLVPDKGTTPTTKSEDWAITETKESTKSESDDLPF